MAIGGMIQAASAVSINERRLAKCAFHLAIASARATSNFGGKTCSIPSVVTIVVSISSELLLVTTVLGSGYRVNPSGTPHLGQSRAVAGTSQMRAARQGSAS